MANKVFLLGAGFSKPAGFPLANDLLNFVRSYLNESSNGIDIGFKEELEIFINGIEHPLLSNIELLLTYIDLALSNHSIGMFTHYASSDELQVFRLKFSGAIVRAFDNGHQKLNPKKDMYQKFCHKLQDGDTVVTFNYDVVIEQGLWEQNKWTFLDGYGLKKDVNNFQAPFGGAYPSDLPTESLIKVYKLHGSLGWIDDSNNQIIFRGMPDYFQDYRLLYCEKNLYAKGARWDEGTTFIEPTYVKRFNCKPMLDLWKQSFQALQQSDEIIIIGYSLPEADAFARTLLASGVFKAASSITVVNPDASVFDNFERILDKKIIKKKMSFEEWMD